MVVNDWRAGEGCAGEDSEGLRGVVELVYVEVAPYLAPVCRGAVGCSVFGCLAFGLFDLFGLFD